MRQVNPIRSPQPALDNGVRSRVVSQSRSGEELLIDDVLFVPWTPFDGSWYVIVGNPTKFLLDDKFTWNDSATDSVIQRWLWRAYGVYLPHDVTSGITITDPT